MQATSALFSRKKNEDVTVDGQQAQDKRFAAVGNSVTDKIERVVADPSDAAWDWFLKTKASAQQNIFLDFSRYYDVFGRALPAWRIRKFVEAAAYQHIPLPSTFRSLIE